MSLMAVGAKNKRPKEEHASFRAMYAYVKPHRLWLALGLVLALVTSAGGLAIPLVVRTLIEDIATHHGIAVLITLMCVLVVAVAAVGSVGQYILRRGAESIVLGARKRLVDHLMRLTVGGFDSSEPGDLMARASADPTLLRDAIAMSFVGLATGVLTVVATLIIMGIVDWLLLLVSWGAMALAGVLIAFVVPRVRTSTEQAQESVGAMGAALERVLGAFRTVKAYGAERRVAERIDAAAGAAWQANVRAGIWQSVILNIAVLAVQAAFLVVLAVGGAQVTSGRIGVGTLIAFLLYVSYLMNPMTQAVLAVTQYQVGSAAVARIQAIERIPVEPVQPAQETVLEEGDPLSVDFEEVRFSYRPELEVLKGLSFVIPARGMTAFVGPSGAGKTTIFSLIERFYEPDSGRILIGGTDSREWPLGRLRAVIGYVEQDAPVLAGTLRENVTFGAPQATADEVDNVLRIARLTELVGRLPDGLETQVGHSGSRLSGGERQRVAIARALLRRPRLLLLDEATSQLDAINEAALRETVAEVSGLVTVLVVAHRLSTVTAADRIIVLDAGSVQAIGTHRELIADNALYAELADTQFVNPSMVAS
jgi:ABC-type multidrug transport system fused ATPase/permease subunit